MSAMHPRPAVASLTVFPAFRVLFAGFILFIPFALFALFALAAPAPAAAQAAGSTEGPTEGEYLYRVTLLRAAPGHFSELAAAIRDSHELAERAGDPSPFWIRHSQGDHWDFMVLEPMGDFDDYYAPARATARAAVWDSEAGQAVASRLRRHLSYQEDWYARSIPVEAMAGRFDGAGLFHVEMFAGLPGKRAELVRQRQMENRYYENLDRPQNVIFVREAGSNWDAMTIGFHADLQAFAAGGARYSAEEQDDAAWAAGFAGVSSVGPYLRSLLSYHRDTLGVRPPG